jgi:hypothetical protein
MLSFCTGQGEMRGKTNGLYTLILSYHVNLAFTSDPAGRTKKEQGSCDLCPFLASQDAVFS